METVPEQETVSQESVDDSYQAHLQHLQNLEVQKLQIEQHKEMEESRRNHERQIEIRRAKIDMVKVATDTLTSNARSKPVDERDISATDIKTFADELIQYINQE